ncbi:MAG: RNA-binding protein [Chitinispirillia bacterium]|nr:RNA-binding protein [Chitinispirillia bacterium]MCL2268323.1 RNA-binding protein [Chitinispirillia bacterium]
MKTKKLYIGNIPYYITEKQLRDLFRWYEPIHSIVMISDKETRLSRGYGFIELEEPKAEAAMYELDNKVFMGRKIRVCNAYGRDPKRDEMEKKRLESLNMNYCLNCPLVKAIGARMGYPHAINYNR